MSTDWDDAEGDEWDNVFSQIELEWDILNDWERELISKSNPYRLTKDQKDQIHEIYYERFIEKIPGRDRQKE